MAFPWCCPFCNRNATIDSKNSGKGRYEFNFGNKYGYQAAHVNVVSCPNPECLEYTLEVSIHDHIEIPGQGYKDVNPKKEWGLIPQARTKYFPDYVPQAIIDDYQEACSIKELSAKASATLSRRCLQGMIRDFWGVKKGRLVDEIDAIQDKVDPMTWSAIDAIRKIGNIGAHMEKDINLIIDVDKNEAGLLVGLIETLISDWYVAREERKKRLESIVAIAKEKDSIKAVN